ncbi:hypothetical protein PHPALM_31461 [Phytophthora palmivora]|uniref:Uncharacterized protein n=1 Tax=Phytophthora palmivora TaxID=4796 RepID=A0A2P4X2J3_9STRA|nr:hypothetical protein PHPALM_31461 [Phytophthora palmivora]
MKPAVRYEDSLAGKPTVAPPKDDAPEKEKEGHALQLAFVDQQESYIMDLLSLTMPASYKLDDKQFEQAVHADFKSVNHLFARLKALKDQVNRNSGEALQTGVISSNRLMLKVLGVLPNHLWGQAIDFTPPEFTLDRVEAKLRAIFGRKNIYAVGKAGPRKPVHDPVPKMIGKAKKVRREVPIQECLQAAVPVDACRAVQEKAPPSHDGYVSPPPSALELPLTPGRGTAPFDDEDEPMDSVVNAVDVDAKDKSQDGPQQSDGDEAMEEKAVEVNNQGIVATTERFAGMMSELESKAADSA